MVAGEEAEVEPFTKFIDSYIEFTPSCSSALMVVDVESTDEMEKVRTYDAEVVREYSNSGVLS